MGSTSMAQLHEASQSQPTDHVDCVLDARDSLLVNLHAVGNHIHIHRYGAEDGEAQDSVLC